MPSAGVLVAAEVGTLVVATAGVGAVGAPD
jgi:hypothetical protein